MSSTSDEVARVHALEAHDAQLAAIVRAVKLAVISVDETQTIVLFNPEAEAVFRCGAAQALGGPLDRFIPAAARVAHRQYLANFDGRPGKRGARSMGGDRILTGLRADGKEFPIDASIISTEVAGRKWYTVILRDVTERVRDRQQLQFLSNIVESSSQAILSRDREGTIMSWNEAAAHIFGYTQKEAVGQNIRMLFSNEASRDYTGLAERAMRGEPVVNFETRRQRKDGTLIDVEVTISPIKHDDGSVVGTSAIYSDITERKRMEAQMHKLINDQRQAEAQVRESRDRLRELSAALQIIREEEKTRIARELHDELGQALTALKMDAAAIASDLDPAQEAPLKRTAAMKQLIDATVASVRRISADLRPVMLDNLGLVPTLEWLTRQFSDRTGIRVDLDIPDENLGVSGDAATAIFRIVQEALTNVARHSGADEVGIEVRRQGGNVVTRIRDNGKGFSEPDTRKARSFGLLGMRERAYVLGGDMKISSLAQKGTQIEAVIPAFGTVQGRGS